MDKTIGNTNKPIINCHTHIFTGDYVPPFLAKTFLPWPLHYLLPISLIICLFRFWFKIPYRWKFKPWFKKIKEINYNIKLFIKRHIVLYILSIVLNLFIGIQVLFIMFDWLSIIQSPGYSIIQLFITAKSWLEVWQVIYIPSSVFGKIVFVLILFAFFKIGRNLVMFILKMIWSFFRLLPGTKTKELIRRYLNLGRFSFYTKQISVFKKLRDQYPRRTRFVILPMDMEYMGAGKRKRLQYDDQMEALKTIKRKKIYEDVFYPFVFVDPRRKTVGKKPLFKLRYENEKLVLNEKGKVILDDCFIKDYIEKFKFNGFKIYPALGYYPFEKELLPIWRYAADYNIPIMTHCCKGVIFYRGKKKKKWDKHPYFEGVYGKNKYGPLRLMETKNSEFTANFTHPLNFLCLLKEELLRKVVADTKDEEIFSLFGYDKEHPDNILKNDLSKLKICFGHFGGDDQWHKYLDSDRDNYSKLLKKYPNGISFLTYQNNTFKSRGKIEQLWRYTDWYSIICSIMLQHEHTYADVSFILHNPEIQALLNETLKLKSKKLLNRVLYGSDFYVVRHHKSDKHMLALMEDELSEQQFNRIARCNPQDFLSSDFVKVS